MDTTTTTTTTTATTVDADDFLDTLVVEGHDRADAAAAIDSLIDAGLDIDDQPDDGVLLSAADQATVRAQLAMSGVACQYCEGHAVHDNPWTFECVFAHALSTALSQ